MAIIAGLTGGICTGKSSAASILAKQGVRIIDCDELGHYIARYDSECLSELLRQFGMSVFFKHGALNRKALGELVFADSGQRKILEQIMHPRIWQSVEENIAYAKANKQPLVVVVPLLFETKRMDWFDETWLVYCHEELQLSRLKERDGLTEDAAMQRIRSQIPIDEKQKLADRVIMNTGSLADLEADVLAVWRDAVEG